MDALEDIDSNQFIEWKKTVQARILTEAGIEANVLKMYRLDEVLVSKIGGEYHTIPLHGCSNRYGLSKWVTTTLRTNGLALFSAPNHADRYSKFSPTRGSVNPRTDCPEGVRRRFSPRERFRHATCEIEGLFVSYLMSRRIGREAYGGCNQRSEMGGHEYETCSASEVHYGCAENRNSR